MLVLVGNPGDRGNGLTDRTQHHELKLAGVDEFRLFNRIDGPWEYAEVTAVQAAA
jgi:hypothetical protein